MKKITYISPVVLSLLPLIAYAGNHSVGDVITTLSGIFQIAIQALMVLATLVFVWGIIQYVLAGSEEDKSKARQYMTWGILGLVVMVSVWGIVNVIIGTFDLGGETIPIGPGQ